ncbi:MAG TPA: hypothetical protein VFU49_09420 [Ktedonobacteraceae bacterium]|nr:hypothetical protein [Ktedonobacteraceae bacterium]
MHINEFMWSSPVATRPYGNSPAVARRPGGDVVHRVRFSAIGGQGR